MSERSRSSEPAGSGARRGGRSHLQRVGRRRLRRCRQHGGKRRRDNQQRMKGQARHHCAAGVGTRRRNKRAAVRRQQAGCRSARGAFGSLELSRGERWSSKDLRATNAGASAGALSAAWRSGCELERAPLHARSCPLPPGLCCCALQGREMEAVSRRDRVSSKGRARTQASNNHSVPVGGCRRD